MSQFDFNLVATVDNGFDLTNKLNDWRDALQSSHMGGTRPIYAEKGLIWVNDSDPSNAVINIFDGSVDIPIAYVNLNTGEQNLKEAIYISSTPPVNPDDNSLWFESDTGRMYVLYINEDGITKQWVQSGGHKGGISNSIFNQLAARVTALELRADAIEAALPTKATLGESATFANITATGTVSATGEISSNADVVAFK
jgi:hypothetical protein